MSVVFALKKQLLFYYVDVSLVWGLVTFDIILIQRMKKIEILHIVLYLSYLRISRSLWKSRGHIKLLKVNIIFNNFYRYGKNLITVAFNFTKLCVKIA